MQGAAERMVCTWKGTKGRDHGLYCNGGEQHECRYRIKVSGMEGRHVGEGSTLGRAALMLISLAAAEVYAACARRLVWRAKSVVLQQGR